MHVCYATQMTIYIVHYAIMSLSKITSNTLPLLTVTSNVPVNDHMSWLNAVYPVLQQLLIINATINKYTLLFRN